MLWVLRARRGDTSHSSRIMGVSRNASQTSSATHMCEPHTHVTHVPHTYHTHATHMPHTCVNKGGRRCEQRGRRHTHVCEGRRRLRATHMRAKGGAVCEPHTCVRRAARFASHTHVCEGRHRLFACVRSRSQALWAARWPALIGQRVGSSACHGSLGAGRLEQRLGKRKLGSVLLSVPF